jgi:hypothetical protein
MQSGKSLVKSRIEFGGQNENLPFTFNDIRTMPSCHYSKM